MKKFLAVLLALSLGLTLCACDFLQDVVDSAVNVEEKAKTFDFDGISIELTTDFLQMDFISEDYDFIVGNETISVMGLKVAFEETDLGELTALEFAEFFRSAMADQNPTEVTEIEGIPTMQYTAPVDENESQTVAVMYYKATDCFWVVCFAATSEDFDGAYEDICQYAKSVKCE